MRRIQALRIAVTNDQNKSLSIYPKALDRIKKTKCGADSFQIVSVHGKVGTGKSTLLNDITGIPAFETLSHTDRMNQNVHSCTNGVVAPPFIYNLDKINETWPSLFARELQQRSNDATDQQYMKRMLAEKYRNCGMLFWDIEGQGHRVNPQLDDILNAFVSICSNVMLLNCKHFGIGDILNELHNVARFAKAMQTEQKLGVAIIILRDYETYGPLELLEMKLKEEMGKHADYRHLRYLFSDIKVFGLPCRYPDWTDEEARQHEKYGGSLQGLVQYILETLHKIGATNPNQVYTIDSLQSLLGKYDGFDQRAIEKLWKEVATDPEVKKAKEEEQKKWEKILAKQMEQMKITEQKLKKELEDKMREKENASKEEQEQIRRDFEKRLDAANEKSIQVYKKVAEANSQANKYDWVNTLFGLGNLCFNAYDTYKTHQQKNWFPKFW
eukprot:521483_1